MFVLYNEILNRYFTHPKSEGVWSSSDSEDAHKMLEHIKHFVVASGYPEIADGLRVFEIPMSVNQ
jgi:hypothetical protein